MKLNQHRFKTDFHFIVPKMRFFPQHCTFSDNTKHTTQKQHGRHHSKGADRSARSGLFSEAYFLKQLWLQGSGSSHSEPFCTSVLCTCAQGAEG